MCKFKIRTLVLIFTILILLNIYSTSKFHYSNFVKFGNCPGVVIFHRKWRFLVDLRDSSSITILWSLFVSSPAPTGVEYAFVGYKPAIFIRNWLFWLWKWWIQSATNQNYAEIGLDGFWKVSKHLKISILKTHSKFLVRFPTKIN